MFRLLRFRDSRLRREEDEAPLRLTSERDQHQDDDDDDDGVLQHIESRALGLLVAQPLPHSSSSLSISPRSVQQSRSLSLSFSFSLFKMRSLKALLVRSGSQESKVPDREKER